MFYVTGMSVFILVKIQMLYFCILMLCDNVGILFGDSWSYVFFMRSFGCAFFILKIFLKFKSFLKHRSSYLMNGAFEDKAQLKFFKTKGIIKMKKLLCYILVIVTIGSLFLCGCSQQTSPEYLHMPSFFIVEFEGLDGQGVIKTIDFDKEHCNKAAKSMIKNKVFDEFCEVKLGISKTNEKVVFTDLIEIVPPEKITQLSNGETLEFSIQPSALLKEKNITIIDLQEALNLEFNVKLEETVSGLNVYGKLLKAKAGDVIKFGKYELNNEMSKEESIEWIVLENDGKELFLLSRLCLASKKFLERLYFDTECNSWEYSTLRKWLNEDFYKDAFSFEEQEMIKKSTLFTEAYEIHYEEFPSVTTQDKVFLLSASEVLKYFPNKKDRAAGITKYAYAQCDEVFFNKGNVSWWLRSRSKATGIYGVDSVWPGFGSKAEDIGNIYNPDATFVEGVRPAIKIDLTTIK